MLRPTGGQLARYVDATKCAHVEAALERDFTLEALPRLQEAGAKEQTAIALHLQFVRVEQRIAMHGTLTGCLELVCQRCLGMVRVPLQERFKLVIVADEAAAAQEVGEYEPIIADCAKLDLNSVAEEQGLLAMPLVARHEPDECGQQTPRAPGDATDTQRPFGNLRDMMRGR
jgi:uncharacterized protein